MRREKLSHDELISLLMYDKDTGIFRRRIGVRGAKSLSVAGFVNSRGYVEISVRGSKYYAHRLAWLYIHGSWPEEMIDHINGIKSDNRIVNLREASMSQNQSNRGAPVSNSSGFKGVSWDSKKGKWQAKVMVNGKTTFLGYYCNPKDAANAASNGRARLHGRFAKS